MWLFYAILLVASSGRLIAFAQESNSFGADGFVFDGPTNRPSFSDAVTSSGVRSSTVTPASTTTTTTTPTSASPLTDVEFDACVARCPTTPEYNPVCSSDNGDYDNPGHLSCAAACGKDITIKYYGRCTTTKIRGG